MRLAAIAQTKAGDRAARDEGLNEPRSAPDGPPSAPDAVEG